MNSFKICLHNHFDFNGFTVQPGMIFGIDMAGNSIISNGKPFNHGYFIYTNANNLDGEFVRIHITKESHPQIFTKIEKALRQRERKNIDGVEYRTSAQLETERWAVDGVQKFFRSISVPVGHTPRISAEPYPKASANYNSIKERNTLTQRENICRYTDATGYITVI